MREVRVNCVSLNKGLRCLEYESIEEGNKAAGKDVMLGYANSYLIQKGALVEGRDILSTMVETLTANGTDKPSLPWLMKTVKVTKDGKEESKQVPDETDREYLNRFRAAVFKGDITIKGGAVVTTEEGPPGTDGKATEVKKNRGTVGPLPKNDKDAVEAWLQTLADLLGPFAADSSKPEKEVKERKLADEYLDAAKRIVANNTTKKWLQTFKTENIEVSLPENPTPEQTTTAIGWAIKERVDRQRKAAVVQYN